MEPEKFQRESHDWARESSLADSPISDLPDRDLLSRFAPLRPVPLCPEIVAHQADDIFELWRVWEEQSGCQREIPYWAVVWPGAIALARMILDNRLVVDGRRVVDVGCGAGVVSIAAVQAGAAEVIANDTDPVALGAARINAVANGLRITTEGGDLTVGEFPQDNVLICVADLFYERSVALRLTSWLKRALDWGAEVIVSDAGRPFAPRSMMQMLYEIDIPVSRDIEGVEVRRVTIGRFTDML